MELFPPPDDSLYLERTLNRRQSLRHNFIALRIHIALPGDRSSRRPSRASDPPAVDLVLKSVDSVLLGMRVAAYW